MAHTIYPQTVNGRDAITILPSWHAHDAVGLQPLIVFHGHGAADAAVLQQGASMFGVMPCVWADQGGFAVSLINIGTTWLDQQGMDWVLALYNGLISIGAVGKACLAGFSMGGGGALRWLIEHPTLVACARVWSPTTDLQAMYNENNATWNAEMDADYAGNFAVNGVPRSPINNVAAYRGGPKVRISHPSDDAVVPPQNTTDFIAAVNDASVTLMPGNAALSGGHAVATDPAESLAWFRDHRAA